MKLKTIIGTIALAASTCFGATDAELKAMLDAKDYNGFAFTANNIQLTNLLDKTSAPNVVTEYAKANILHRTKYIITAQLIDPIDAINIYVENKNSEAMYLAADTKNDDLIIDTWSKLIDIPEIDIKPIFFVLWSNIKIKQNNLELTKKTANRILKEYPINYTSFIYYYDKTASDDYKLWAKECVLNINKETCNLVGFKQLIPRNFGKTINFYFENIFKINSIDNSNVIVKYLYYTDYYNQAIEVLANNLIDPESAYKRFSLEADKIAKNKEMTKRMWPVISKDIHLGLDAAKYLNDVDKVIDILLVAKEELSAEELNSVIPMINALEIDYRKDDIIKALRNINGRYTLKLYDDRETWEPVLSKIRALIDVRQM
jgi:hypothetical protein